MSRYLHTACFVVSAQLQLSPLVVASPGPTIVRAGTRRRKGRGLTMLILVIVGWVYLRWDLKQMWCVSPLSSPGVYQSPRRSAKMPSTVSHFLLSCHTQANSSQA